MDEKTELSKRLRDVVKIETVKMEPPVVHAYEDTERETQVRVGQPFFPPSKRAVCPCPPFLMVWLPPWCCLMTERDTQKTERETQK